MSAKKKSPNFKSFLRNKTNTTPIKSNENTPSDFESNEEEKLEQIEVNKKRKIEEEEQEDEDEEVDLQENDILEGEDGLNIFGEVIGAEDQDTLAEEPQQEEETTENKEKKPVLKKGKLDSKKLEKFNAEQEKRGIVYLPSIPPRMNPRKIREMMSQFGQIHRSFLVPEKDEVRKNRKKAGGNRGLLYVEGWVEFADKKIAKRVAQSLNGTTISKQGSRFHRDFVWNIKYLSKVKWYHLTAKISYERAFMLKKLRTELSAKKRENEEYLRRSERAKISQRVNERAAKREAKRQQLSQQ